MIPQDFVEQWRIHAQWQTQAMIEQDLVISRALVTLYSDSMIKDTLIFRGGTALNKLFIKPPARYSEDIDFVQKQAEPIGKTLDKIRELLGPWLGEPKRKLTERSAKLIYQYQAINGLPAKLKIEINTTEHFQVLPFKVEFFAVDSEWFKGQCEVITYQLEELMATKLRALYQRRKGRDLFDLWYVLKHQVVDVKKVITIFQQYCDNEGLMITSELFQKNMELKRQNKDFQVEMNVLLPQRTEWNFEEAYRTVWQRVIDQM